MATTILKIDDIKTKADEHKFIDQECITKGLLVSISSYLVGIVAIPTCLFLVKRQIPIGYEYRLAIGGLSSMFLSYFAGDYSKRKCEEKVKMQIRELAK